MQEDDTELRTLLLGLAAADLAPRSGRLTRERCHALLARRRAPRGEGLPERARKLWSLLEPAFVSALSLLCVGGAVDRAVLILLR